MFMRYILFIRCVSLWFPATFAYFSLLCYFLYTVCMFVILQPDMLYTTLNIWAVYIFIYASVTKKKNWFTDAHTLSRSQRRCRCPELSKALLCAHSCTSGTNGNIMSAYAMRLGAISHIILYQKSRTTSMRIELSKLNKCQILTSIRAPGSGKCTNGGFRPLMYWKNLPDPLDFSHVTWIRNDVNV